MKHARASDGHDIYYQTWGDPNNTPMILLQGLGVDSRGYGLQRYLLSKDYYCVAIDHRGSGKSTTTAPFNLYRLARDVLKVMEEESIDSAHVVGTSMGGIVAQILGVVYPQKVKTLSLVATSCVQADWRAELLLGWKARLQNRHSHVLDKDILTWLIGPRLLHRSQLFLPIAQELFKEIDVDGFCLQIDAVTSFSDDFARKLYSMMVPTNVIVGSQDTLTPVGDSEKLCIYIPNSRLNIIYGAAHGIVIESPIEVARGIISFIQDMENENSIEVRQSLF